MQQKKNKKNKTKKRHKVGFQFTKHLYYFDNKIDA